MNIFRYESSKIWSKRIVLIGLALLFAWFVFYFYVSNKDYECVDNGVVYHGTTAVAKNKEIVKQFEGSMTMEKAQKIVDLYGFSVYEDPTETGYYRGGNYCSQWVTDYLTPYTETYSYDADELAFYSGDQSEKLEKYTGGNLNFTYLDGWKALMMCLNMMILLLDFIIVIAVANVFTEEYTLKTAPILLTTEHGKARGIWAKVLAAISFSVIAYLLVAGIVLVSFCCFYGSDGLSGSAALMGRLAPETAGIFGTSVGAVLAEVLLTGLISVIMSTCITLAVSAACKQPFTSILAGLGMLILPYIYVNYIAPLLPSVGIVKLLELFAEWCPLYLPISIVGPKFLPAIIFVLVVSITTAFLGYHQYKSYEETS